MADCITCENRDVCEELCEEDTCDTVRLIKEQQAEIERLNALLKEQQPERKTGEWKRMSDLPAEQDDRYECSSCGNVVHYKDRILLNTFNDFCGRCGSYNGFKFKE